jgi:hypothetical protein
MIFGTGGGESMAKDADVNFLGALPLEIDIRTDVDEGTPTVAKDPDTTVGALVKSKGATIKSFVRFEVGEGIEKKEENFADEVMAW